MNKYLLILLTCAVAYIIPQIFYPINNGPAFFANNAFWSAFVIFCLLHIGNSKVIITICVIEAFAILVFLGAATGYETDFEYFLDHHGTIVKGLNLIEVATLIVWMLIDGFATMDSRVGGILKFLGVADIHRLHFNQVWFRNSPSYQESS